MPRLKSVRSDDVCDTVTHKTSKPSSSTSQDPRATKSSKALGDALLALLDQKPFDQITIRDIVAEAGVHYATFFRHHQTKESLFDQVAAEQIERLIQLSLPAFERAEKEECFLTICSYVDEHRAHWRAFFKSGATAAMRTRLLTISHDYVRSLPLPGGISLPMELNVIYNVTILIETLAWWMAQPEGQYPVPAAADILGRAMLAVQALAEPQA